MTSKVSFTVRRPTPVSRDNSSGPESDLRASALPRHLAHNSTPNSPLSRSRTSSPARYYETPDSSDEEDESRDELVTAFDAMGAQRLHERKKESTGPLVIPALKNRDWRELARKRRTAGQFVPESAKATTGQDGSVGGLGTRDTINSGPARSGIYVKTKTQETEGATTVEQEEEVDMVDVKEEVVEEETEDQKALRAILSEANGVGPNATPIADIIPSISEADALKQDVEELPDVASLEDYARVPVEQFGLALLRGMGWKEGTAASRKPGKGMIQPYLPEARPALLGIGAKPQEVYDDGSDSKKRKGGKQDLRYIPILKQESSSRRESSQDSRRDNGSTSHSRRTSRSRSPSRRDRDERRRYDNDDRRRDSSRRDYDRKESSRRDYDRRDDSDRYSRRRD
ncbi:G-patch domain-containing protein [Mycena indigotica]|uniref:G-patch domain-containing protein n=1 Tax=Mycena indigotica TaxID=2126181 RepID=A0A8H6WEW8_9AGAR|nr:G-patch domain-containing protein [Mycena indigotica]KAF7315242.1 G-patch domain-containing protein [Mycena indigotica]